MKTRPSRGSGKPRSTAKGRASSHIVGELTDASVVHALDSGVATSHVKRSGKSGKTSHGVTIHVAKSSSVKGRNLKGLLLSKPIIIREHALKREKITSSDRILDERKSIVDRLAVLNVAPGKKLSGADSARVFKSIRSGAEKITGSKEVAVQLLTVANFDGTGKSAEELIREGRSGRILARLDDLRYGSRG